MMSRCFDLIMEEIMRKEGERGRDCVIKPMEEARQREQSQGEGDGGRLESLNSPSTRCGRRHNSERQVHKELMMMCFHQ